MGRTNPTYRDALSAIEDRWTPYRRTLRRQDRERFDRLFAYAREHADAAGTRNHRNPLVAALVGIALEQERRHDAAADERDALDDRIDAFADDLAAARDGIEAAAAEHDATASRLDAIEDRLCELEARVDAAAMDYHLDETALDDRLADAAIDGVGGSPRPGVQTVAMDPGRPASPQSADGTQSTDGTQRTDGTQSTEAAQGEDATDQPDSSQGPDGGVGSTDEGE